MTQTYSPKTIEEALKIREQTKALPFAGGTDLMVEHFIGSNTIIQFPKPIVFLSGIAELAGIKKEANSLIIGAGTTFCDIMRHKDTPEVLAQSAGGIAGPPIRNIATIGGNICNASPSADSLPALYATNAQLVLQSINGKRIIPIAEFITGVAKTTLAENELLTHVIIPLETYEKTYYRKIGTRKANALSKLAFCALMLKQNDSFVFRITFCTMGTTITRNLDIEKQYAVKNISDWKNKIGQIQAEYAKILKPRDSARSTALYRSKTAQNLIRDFFETM